MNYDLEICFAGMRRSGNHAVINWLLSLFPNRSVAFFNDLPLGGGHSRAPTALPNCVRWNSREEPPVLAYSVEDKQISLMMRRSPRPLYPPKRLFTLVLVLRDPYNLFASVLQHAYYGACAKGDKVETEVAYSPSKRGIERSPHIPVNVHRLRHCWKEHARIFLGDQGVDFGNIAGRANIVPVSYNAWFCFEWYRRNIASHFGLPYSEAALESIPPQGGGSSFSGRQLNGRGSNLPVLERWRLWADHCTYRDLFDEPLIALSRRIFGPQVSEEAALGRGRSAI